MFMSNDSVENIKVFGNLDNFERNILLPLASEFLRYQDRNKELDAKIREIDASITQIKKFKSSFEEIKVLINEFSDYLRELKAYLMIEQVKDDAQRELEEEVLLKLRSVLDKM
jgi:hypothetical protein